MDLDQMQDLLNNLEVFFKVFVYDSDVVSEKEVILRVFHGEEEDSFITWTDITFDFNGKMIKCC